MPRYDMILVCGTDQSNRPTVTALLERSGWKPPKVVRSAKAVGDAQDPRRHALDAFHDELLDYLERPGLDLRATDASVDYDAMVADHLDRVNALFDAEFDDATEIILTGSSLGRLLPFWRAFSDQGGHRLRVVMQLSGAADFAAQLRRTRGVSAAEGRFLWARDVAMAERNSRGVPRAIVPATDLIRDWRAASEDLCDALGLPSKNFSKSAAAAIEAILATETQTGAPNTDLPAPFDWVSDLAEQLAGALKDDADLAEIDRIDALLGAACEMMPDQTRPSVGTYRALATIGPAIRILEAWQKAGAIPAAQDQAERMTRLEAELALAHTDRDAATRKEIDVERRLFDDEETIARLTRENADLKANLKSRHAEIAELLDTLETSNPDTKAPRSKSK